MSKISAEFTDGLVLTDIKADLVDTVVLLTALIRQAADHNKMSKLEMGMLIAYAVADNKFPMDKYEGSFMQQ